MTIPAIAHPPKPGEPDEAGVAVVPVVVGGCAVVDVAPLVVVVVLPPDAANATTLAEVGTSMRSAPNDGVGKWLLTAPTLACATTLPVAGSSP